MTPAARLATEVLVGALRRRVAAAGGFATVLARGDATAGGLLLSVTERGALPRLLERGFDIDGRSELRPAGPQVIDSEGQVTEYWQRRRRADTDLWVVELDVAQAERFAAEVLGVG